MLLEGPAKHVIDGVSLQFPITPPDFQTAEAWPLFWHSSFQGPALRVSCAGDKSDDIFGSHFPTGVTVLSDGTESAEKTQKKTMIIRRVSHEQSQTLSG